MIALYGLLFVLFFVLAVMCLVNIFTKRSADALFGRRLVWLVFLFNFVWCCVDLGNLILEHTNA